MAPQNYEILIRKKIPFLSKALFWLIMIFMSVLFIFYLIMYPAKDGSQEMSIPYYVLVVPGWVKNISLYAFIGLVIIIPLYYRAKLHENANLIFDLYQISIKSKSENKILPFNSIKEVWCNDIQKFSGDPKLQIVLRQNNGPQTTFFLKDYDCSDSFMETAIDNLKTAKFSFYDKESFATHDQDD